MNLPNTLTMSRFFMAALMMVLLFVPFPFGNTLALVVFVLAGITDALDGRLARRVYGITPFGTLFDPLADKVLVCAAFVSFVEIHIPGAKHPIAPAWIVVVIISREFLVTGLRVLAGSRGLDIAAGRWGKHKTIWQIIVIGVVLLGLAVEKDILPRFAPGALAVYDHWFGLAAYGMVLFAAAITVVSGYVYFHQHRDLLAQN